MFSLTIILKTQDKTFSQSPHIYNKNKTAKVLFVLCYKLILYT